MAVRLRQNRAVGSLSILPLIDVVFLLLVFFLVTTRFEEEEQHVELDLPSASEAVPLTSQPDQLIVNIRKSGEFIIDGKERNLEDVESILSRAATNNAVNQNVIIRADKSVEWQYTLAVINLCKKVGIQNYDAQTDD